LGVRETLFGNAVLLSTVNNSSSGHASNDASPPDDVPFDVKKYHRALVSGLVGLAASFVGFFALCAVGHHWEACGSLLSGFFVPFTIQLSVEYGLKPKAE
jgi:hypothetical protein